MGKRKAPNTEGLVIDPFGGSGTTYAVSEAFNRKWLGSETNIEYCNIIRKRLSDKEHIARISDESEEAAIIERRRKLRGQQPPDIIGQKS